MTVIILADTTGSRGYFQRICVWNSLSVLSVVTRNTDAHTSYKPREICDGLASQQGFGENLRKTVLWV
jgi:hypothetical protein